MPEEQPAMTRERAGRGDGGDGGVAARRLAPATAGALVGQPGNGPRSAASRSLSAWASRCTKAITSLGERERPGLVVGDAEPRRAGRPSPSPRGRSCGCGGRSRRSAAAARRSRRARRRGSAPRRGRRRASRVPVHLARPAPSRPGSPSPSVQASKGRSGCSPQGFTRLESAQVGRGVGRVRPGRGRRAPARPDAQASAAMRRKRSRAGTLPDHRAGPRVEERRSLAPRRPPP